MKTQLELTDLVTNSFKPSQSKLDKKYIYLSTYSKQSFKHR